jgi:hypothetical protein
MMKRVFKTRVVTCAMLLAVFLLAGGVGAPAFARDDMSNGQTGDPTDGLDATPDGGSTSPIGSKTSSHDPDVRGPRIPILIPVSCAGVLIFRVIYVPLSLNVER